MEKKQKICNLWLKAIFMNLVIIILANTIFQPSYETCDDNYLSAILYGAYGEYNAHLIYINIFLGKLLKLLLVICPNLPWYAIVQYLGLFLSFVIITYVILNNKENEYRNILSWSVLVVFGYECYVKVQYTKTAGIMTIAGMLFIYEAFKAKKVRTLYLIIGSIVAVIGSLWRFNGFLMVFPIIGIVALLLGVSFFKEGNRKRFVFIGGIYGVLLVTCILFNIINNKIYNNDDEWKQYIEFNSLRTELLDYGFPPYEENREVYCNNGISKNDLELYRYWNYGDPDRFTEDTLKNVIEAKEEKKLTVNTIKEFFREFPVRYLSYPYFLLIIIILAVWILNTNRNKFAIALITAVIVAIEFYLYFKGRYLINRIDVPIMMAFCIVLILQIKKIRYESFHRYTVAAIIGGILLSGTSFLTNQRLPVTRKEKEAAREVLNLIASDKSNFYILENYTSDNLWTTAYSIWDIPPVGIHLNSYVMGSWRYRAPFTEYIKKSYGVENPYRDIVDNPQIYMVNDYYMSAVVNYIKEHYCKDASAQLLKEINGHRMYKIVSKRPTLKTETAKKMGKDIKYKFSLSCDENGSDVLEGYIYKKESNAYYQKVYVGRYDKQEKKEYFYPMTASMKSWKEERNNKYSWYSIPLSNLNIDNKEELMRDEDEWKIYLEVNGELYGQTLRIK